MQSQEEWSELHKEMRHQPKYPEDCVIRFVKKNFERGDVLLDSGCGAGRHIVFMANEGYIPYGIDYSSNGVECSKTRLREITCERYVKNIIQCSCTNLPFDNDFFDGIISYGVLYYLSIDDIRKAISEMFRVLKSGGKCLIYIRTIDDYRFRKSDTLSEDKYACVVKETDAKRSAYKENGMIMRFFTRNEVLELLKPYRYKDLEINSEKIYHENDAYADVNYLVTFAKE